MCDGPRIVESEDFAFTIFSEWKRCDEGEGIKRKAAAFHTRTNAAASQRTVKEDRKKGGGFVKLKLNG